MKGLEMQNKREHRGSPHSLSVGTSDPTHDGCWLPHFPFTCYKKAPQTRVLLLAFQQSTLRLAPTPEQHLARWHAVDSRGEKRELVPPGMAAPEGEGRIQSSGVSGFARNEGRCSRHMSQLCKQRGDSVLVAGSNAENSCSHGEVEQNLSCTSLATPTSAKQRVVHNPRAVSRD